MSPVKPSFFSSYRFAAPAILSAAAFASPEGDGGNTPPDRSNWIAPEVVSEQYIPKTHFEAELTRLTKGKMTESEFLKNEALISAAATKLGFIKTDDPEQKKKQEEYLASLRTQMERDLVEPLKGENEKLKGVVESARRQKFHGDVLREAAGRVKPELLLKVGNGQPAIVALLEHAFAYSEDHDAYFVKNAKGDSFEPSTAQGSRDPYKGVGEYLDSLRSDPELKQIFVASTQGAGNVRANGGRTTTISGDDDAAFLANLDGIANGTVTVR